MACILNSILKPATTSILLFISLVSYSQNARVIGKTINSTTNEPVPYASIYFNASSIGTASDSLGHFEIKNIPIELSELIASSIGFKTLSTSIKLAPNKTTVVEFRMDPDVTMLSSIVVRDKRDKRWEKLYSDFCKYFIGETNNSKQTTIINPEVLDLTYDASTKILTASANEPVELENRALGYQISITIEKFEASDNHYAIQIKSFYKTITPKNELQALQWQKNRIETFRGSKRHFFLSVINGTVNQQGFSVQKSSISPHEDISEFNQSIDLGTYTSNLNWEDLLSDSTEGNYKVLAPGIFKISYRRSDEDLNSEANTTSWIEVNDPYLNLYPNGIVKIPANFWQLGYFEKLRLADQLPSDYNFWEEEMRFLRISNAGRGKLTGTVRDENDNPIKDATIFINNGLTQTETNYWGQFEFDQLPAGEYPMVFTHPTMQPVLKVISVDTSELAEAVVTMKAKGMDLMNYEPASRKIQKNVLRAIQHRYKKLQISISNPENLYYKHEQKATNLIAEKPLILVSKKLGYQWTFHVENFSINNHELSNHGFFKFDTIAPLNSKEKEKWFTNRRRAYHGTWNQFLNSLIDGKLLENEIKVYDDSPEQNKEPISYDSLIELKNGKIWLTLQKKAKVKFPQTGSRNKKIKSLYLEPRISKIQLSKSGVFDPFKLDVISPGSGKLPLIPLDQSITKDLLKRTSNNSLIEKIHVHADKPYYYPGDTIWFKVFLKYEFKAKSDLTSKVLHLDLINDKGIFVRSIKIPIENGKANGDLLLSEDLPPGNFTLRAYTRYSAASNYYFFKPIPILPLNESIESSELEKDVIHPDLSIKLNKEKELYQLGDTIKLTLDIMENGQFSSGEFSVSVTDQLSVGTIENNNVKTLPFSENEIYQRYEVNLQPEQGLTHKIKILDGEPDETYRLTALVTKNAAAISTTIRGNSGTFVLNFYDSTTVYLKCTDSMNKEFEVEFLNSDIPVTLLPDPILYKSKKGVPRSNLISYLSGDTVALLDEVMIKAKRIERQKTQDVIIEPMLSNIYSTLNDRQLQEIRKTNDLVEGLHSAIPQLNNPSIRFSLYINGRIEEPTILRSLPANQISRVDVYPRPMNAVSIYTESMIPYKGKNPNIHKLMGFTTPHRFYGGNSEFNEFRATVYWNHTLKVNSGVGTFKFPTSKSHGSYKIVIEGMTDTSKSFRIVDYIKIAER